MADPQPPIAARESDAGDPAVDTKSKLLAQLFGGDFGAEDAASPPAHWPSLPAEEYGDAMRDLFDWAVRRSPQHPPGPI